MSRLLDSPPYGQPHVHNPISPEQESASGFHGQPQVGGCASAGKMLGLHNGNGHVMWSLAFPQGQAPQQLFLWRSSHDLQKAPQVLALHSSETTSSYSVVDAHTGKEVSSGTVDIAVFQVMCTPVISSYKLWCGCLYVCPATLDGFLSTGEMELMLSKSYCYELLLSS